MTQRTCLLLAFAFLGLVGPWVASQAGSVAADRILTPPDDNDVMPLRGNTHPNALPEADRGAVAASFAMNHLQMVLKRSELQEAALERFMEEQTDPTSSHFHQWLQPEEFGNLYGPSANDLHYLTSWLQSHGLSIDQVNKGQTFIEFHGTAAQVAEAFHTEIHEYALNGEQYYGNNVDPSIPTALASVVTGISLLNDFPGHSMHTPIREVHRDIDAGKWLLTDSSSGPTPDYLPPSNSGKYLYEGVGPNDFATIYNVLPLWNAGITGAGQKIAIAGDSDINLADVQTFRSFFGLPANTPIKIFNGTSPGYTASRTENTLDVEWSGAVAKNATITLVITAGTASAQVENGEIFSAQYIVDNDLAPVMSLSYGYCELKSGTALNATFNTMWQQAAAEGISVFVSAGDQASAGCDLGFPQAARDGLQVNGWASTPYNTAVGGTDFNWINLRATKTYWGKTNSTTESNALSYIPEVPWNGSCAGAAVEEAYGLTKLGFNQVQSCEYVAARGVDLQLLSVSGGSGGKSACTTPTGTTPGTCAGGYAKPKWQAGVGVPNDGKRDLPDVSLFAADFVLGDAYIMCDSEKTPCAFKNGTDIVAQAVGGTSVASPAMAGIMALVVQKMGARQGNANPALYALAAKDNRTSCNSVSVTAGNACNFYDITTDNTSVPCHVGTPNCYAPSGDTLVGVLTGQSSTKGYDLATGLGSINAYNLVNNWHTVVKAQPFAAMSPSALKFPSTKVGTTSASQTVTLKNTGNASLAITSITVGGTGASSFKILSKTCGSSLAAAASCNFRVAFKPAATGTLSGAISVNDDDALSPQGVSLSGIGT
ncbi:MAG: protease pro-enzyme activation domain-containing protein [Pseudomonadota bacterium]|nr:protease pro-enzyme activation domain-containing protein [Pseudomonadota bacterium]